MPGVRIDVADDLWDEIRRDLLSTSDLERAGIGFAGDLKVGSHRRLLLREWVPVPRDEYLVQLGYHLEVSPVFWARATKRARNTGEALVVFHSHPGDTTHPEFSPSDDGGEARLIPKIQERASVPVAAVVVSPGGWEARVTLPGGRSESLDVHNVGKSNVSHRSTKHVDYFDRQVRALGGAGQAIIRNMTVGVVGAGGLGSHVVQQLVHLGVGKVIVVDPDTVTPSNLSRLIGASWLDVKLGRKKVGVSRRLSQRVGSGTQVVTVPKSVTYREGAESLLDCDVIMGCTDNHWSRCVLNSIAYQYYVPVVDMGVELQASGAAGGRVTWLSPGSACLWCVGVLDPERVRLEQLPKAIFQAEVARGYVEGLDDPAPAVVSINGVIASVGVTELLARITGFAGSEPRATLLLYRLGDGVVRRTTPSPIADCATCSTTGLLGSGDLSKPPWLEGSRTYV